MANWMPNWRAMMARAPEIQLEAADGFVYLIADSHLGDRRAPPGEFLAMLERLEEPRLVVFLGDLFKVWLALPAYWDDQARAVLAGFARLRAAGTHLVFVVGNREFFLPRDPAEARRRGLPFDAIVHDACVVSWGGRRYGLTHGDVVNRRDRQYLRWRRIARSRTLEALFRLLPGRLARRIAERLEGGMAATNQEIKIQYPRDELEAFAQTVLAGLDGFFIGHFHRDETIPVPGGAALLRIVPDWHARRTVLRLHRSGAVESLAFAQEAPP
jgi:UDP-2,3-diacylglucosamine hydrolase